MSDQGLEVLGSTYHKTQGWIGQLAENSHLEKGDAYKALRAVLLTLRDRLPIQEPVHFGAQLPMANSRSLLRRLETIRNADKDVA